MTIILGRKKIKKNNPERCNLTDQVIVLLSTGYQFKFHKSQGHWRLT